MNGRRDEISENARRITGANGEDLSRRNVLRMLTGAAGAGTFFTMTDTSSFAQSDSARTDASGMNEYRYVIYDDGGTYHADSTAFNDFTSEDFGVVLQKAMDELDGEKENRNGGNILISPGVHTIKATNAPVYLRTGVSIIGTLRGFNITADRTDWVYSGINTIGFSEGDDLFATEVEPDDTPENTYIGHLHINPGGTDVNIFHLMNCSGIHFEHVMMEDCQGNGIWGEGAKDVSAQGCQIQAGDLDKDTFSLKFEMSSRHGGQCNYNGTLDYVKLKSGNTMRLRGSGGLRTFVKGPASNETPAAMVQIDGGDFIMADAIIDGGRNEGLHGLRTDENIRLDNVAIQKVDRGLIQRSKGSLSQYDHVKFFNTIGPSIELTGASPAMNSVRISGCDSTAITVGNVRPSNQWANLIIENSDGYAIDLTSLASGKKIRIENTHFRGNSSGDVNGLEYVVWNGMARESANAEQPQGSYRVGEVVEFTDTGDGSGSGTYKLSVDGETWIEI